MGKFIKVTDYESEETALLNVDYIVYVCTDEDEERTVISFGPNENWKSIAVSETVEEIEALLMNTDEKAPVKSSIHASEVQINATPGGEGHVGVPRGTGLGGTGSSDCNDGSWLHRKF